MYPFSSERLHEKFVFKTNTLNQGSIYSYNIMIGSFNFLNYKGVWRTFLCEAMD